MPIVFALAATTGFVFLLCLFFVPAWETNDDVAMSMVVHGYGIATGGFPPNLMFSNILWGYIARAIPEINGVLGYSIATLGVLTIAGATIVHCLLRLGAGYAASISVLVLLLARSVLFPQFTIVSGLPMVAAILCWRLYALEAVRATLIVGCVLAYLSFLVRSQEFLLVLAVGLPLLPLRVLLRRRDAKFAVLLLAGMIAISVFVDDLAYRGEGWHAFNALNRVRVPFTDFRAVESLKARPEILARQGYSINDIDLVQNWFFVDPRIANPAALKALLAELGPLGIQQHPLAGAWEGLQALSQPTLLVTVVGALALSLLHPNWRVATSWGLFITIILALGLLGRPGIVRVYAPMVFLLLLTPFIATKTSGWRVWLVTAILMTAATVNSTEVAAESRAAQIANAETQKAFYAFPTDPVVIWGATLPFEAIYPVLRSTTAPRSYRLYGLGVLTLAPYSVHSSEIRAGRGLLEQLMSDKGVPIFANENLLRLLETYCREHDGRALKYLSARKFAGSTLTEARCVR